MDRTFVYPGAIPEDADLLTLNRNTMIALEVAGLVETAFRFR
jgi:hypothetical protein